MRIKAAVIVALAAGAFVVSGVLLADKRLEPAQLEKVRSACPDCHGEVPAYRAAGQVHGRHAAFECSRCHGGGMGLKAAEGLHAGLEKIFLGITLLVLTALVANQRAIRRKFRPSQASESRNVRRFRGGAILVHWLHAASFAVMLVTGMIMFFDLTDMDGGRLVRTIHKACAVSFVAVPVLFSLFDPRAALGFLKEAFLWSRDDLAWLRSSAGFYFGRRIEMPRQGYLNGDQRLWQLVTAVTGTVFALTGVLMWFFRLKMSLGLYQGILLAHAVSFVLATSLFLLHFYLALLHPRFEESLSSMVDGKISAGYARDHYAKWHER
jgi:formate dehydrogenase subunit gamma